MALDELQRKCFGETWSHVGTHVQPKGKKIRASFQRKNPCDLQGMILKKPLDFARQNSRIFEMKVSSFAMAKTRFFSKTLKTQARFSPRRVCICICICIIYIYIHIIPINVNDMVHTAHNQVVSCCDAFPIMRLDGLSRKNNAWPFQRSQNPRQKALVQDFQTSRHLGVSKNRGPGPPKWMV